MVSNSKILTVSYGTFSCTLEGFDDSFGTMKAIAEYFRDLAADDRYFGAEPPQPDAEMLARIAQREVTRRVQAHTDEGRIVLRVDGPETAVAAAAAVAQPAETPDQRTAADMTQDAVSDTRATPEPEPAQEPDEAQAPEPQDLAPEEDAPDEAMPQQSVMADATAELDVEDDAEDDAPAPEAAQPDSIAAKLQRIRAVVFRNEARPDLPEYTEDQHSDPLRAADVAAIAASRGTSADEIAELFAADDTDDEVASLLDRLDPRDADDAEAFFADSARSEQEIDLDDEDEDVPDADAREPERAASHPAKRTEPQQQEEDSDHDDDGDPELEALLARHEAPSSEPRRARVVRVRRDELDAAMATGEFGGLIDRDTRASRAAALAEPAEDAFDDMDADSLFAGDDDDIAEADSLFAGDEDDDTAGAARADESSLSPEEEAELQSELAEVEAELKAEAERRAAIARAAALENARQKARAARPSADEDLGRLLATADSRLGAPETSSRRTEFGHLRAAVAAKQAEAALGKTETTEDSAYRDDLADAVRPRRPVSSAGGARDSRPAAPAEQRLAPLKLVAEQRIDARTETRGPVRPRRVATEDSDAPDPVGGFADFASRVGAQDLPDLLEAAASYLSFVEGHEQFSRPQLMTKVRMVEQDEFSREDGLRSFGQLLRDGKIAKIKGGRFTVSDRIGFRPDDRAAG